MAEDQANQSDETLPVVEGGQSPTILGIVPLRNVVVFPGMLAPLTIGRERSLAAVDNALLSDKTIGLFTQKDPENEDPGFDDIYHVGSAGKILKMLKLPDGNVSALVQISERIRAVNLHSHDPFLKFETERCEDVYEESKETEALSKNVINQFHKLISQSPSLPDELVVTLVNVEDPGRLADFVAANLGIDVPEKQDIVETLNVQDRLRKVVKMLGRLNEVAEIESKIQQQVHDEFGRAQREMVLRQQMKAIQEELGEADARTIEIAELKKRIDEAKMSEAAEKAALYELDRLEKMHPGAPEYTVSRTYLEWLVSLPWSVSTEDNLDIDAAKRQLDNDHYDLDKVKDRIIEFLAVRKLKSDTKGPILCFVGPPGVGKTSLGRSIAESLGRQFVRISLGGIRDEAEIRGHRRTYIGALPGRILQGLKKAGTNNPVFMLDEIDKVGTDFRGDPSSALLEVLDPEQNNSFSDHYVDVPFDLSKVMFIATANISLPIPPALRDRMEFLELPGYVAEEKVHIARKYLIPRQLSENGLSGKLLAFDKAAIQTIIRRYTREAGVRNLEREIATVCRKVARSVAGGNKRKRRITPRNLSKLLGPAKFFAEVAERTAEPGVVTGLAWTQDGGEILFVESACVPGKKSLTLTGQLGDVMKESVQAALTLVRGRAKKLGIDERFFEQSDIHVHVPAGAIPKDGPSAGVTMVVSLSSLLTKRPVRPDLAMTGEVTLRGKVLPVGGIKEKVLAAHRAGIKTVILPEKNRKDLVDVPANVRADIRFRFVNTIDTVLRTALKDDAGRKVPAKPRRARGAGKTRTAAKKR